MGKLFAKPVSRRYFSVNLRMRFALIQPARPAADLRRRTETALTKTLYVYIYVQIQSQVYIASILQCSPDTACCARRLLERYKKQTTHASLQRKKRGAPNSRRDFAENHQPLCAIIALFLAHTHIYAYRWMLWWSVFAMFRNPLEPLTSQVLDANCYIAPIQFVRSQHGRDGCHADKKKYTYASNRYTYIMEQP